MEHKIIEYTIDHVNYKGYLAYNPDGKKRPGILVVHAWQGQDDFAREKANELAKNGYVAFAVDMYGNGKEAKDKAEAVALMEPLAKDRPLLQKRIVAGLEAFKKQPEVDADKIGGIGFCFGGLTVIELLRSGADVKGVVSFHGTLGDIKEGVKKATIAQTIQGALLILHGNDDPLVTPEEIAYTQKEFTKANVDWQMHIYGQTQHAFTNPKAHGEMKGLQYNKRSAKRAWQSMYNFFAEIFE